MTQPHNQHQPWPPQQAQQQPGAPGVPLGQPQQQPPAPGATRQPVAPQGFSPQQGVPNQQFPPTPQFPGQGHPGQPYPQQHQNHGPPPGFPPQQHYPQQHPQQPYPQPGFAGPGYPQLGQAHFAPQPTRAPDAKQARRPRQSVLLGFLSVLLVLPMCLSMDSTGLITFLVFFQLFVGAWAVIAGHTSLGTYKRGIAIDRAEALAGCVVGYFGLVQFVSWMLGWVGALS